MPSWLPWLFIAALVSAGCYGIGTALLTSDPPPSLPPPTAATPVWFGAELASGEFWATVAVSRTPIPSAVPIPATPGKVMVMAYPMTSQYWTGRERPTILLDPCYGPLRDWYCPLAYQGSPGGMTPH